MVGEVLFGGESLKIIIDGNDGTGKTTLVNSLRVLGYEVQDRGLLTKMTDGSQEAPDSDALYILLDAPVEVCRDRLREAGKDLNEPFHTSDDLNRYRQLFLESARKIPGCVIIDAVNGREAVLAIALVSISERKRPR